MGRSWSSHARLRRGSAKTGPSSQNIEVNVTTAATDAKGTAEATVQAFTSATQDNQSRRDYSDLASVMPGTL
jgi:hypothetical protein